MRSAGLEQLEGGDRQTVAGNDDGGKHEYDCRHRSGRFRAHGVHRGLQVFLGDDDILQIFHPCRKSADLSPQASDFFAKRRDFPAKRRDFPAKRPDLRTERIELSVKRIDFSVKRLDFSANCPEVPAKRCDLSAKRSDLSAKRSDILPRAADFLAQRAHFLSQEADIALHAVEALLDGADLVAERRHILAGRQVFRHRRRGRAANADHGLRRRAFETGGFEIGDSLMRIESHGATIARRQNGDKAAAGPC